MVKLLPFSGENLMALSNKLIHICCNKSSSEFRLESSNSHTILFSAILVLIKGLPVEVAQLNPLHALALIIVSVLLTVLDGLILARLVAGKDSVEALISE